MDQTSTAVTIIIADDHPLIAEGLNSMLKDCQHLKIVAIVSHGKELLLAVDHHRPQVVITDVKMPRLDGIEATRFIKTAYPEIKVIGMSEYEEQSHFNDMMDAGANGYLWKNASKQDFVNAIDAVTRGEPYYCSSTLGQLVPLLNRDSLNPTGNVEFTPREMEIIKLMVREKTSAQIARELGISLRTVETHRHHIQKKIGVKSVVGIVVFAIKNGYVGEVEG